MLRLIYYKKILFFFPSKKGYECCVYYLEIIETANEKGKKNGGLFINGVRGLGFYLKWPIVSVIKHLPSPISFFLLLNLTEKMCSANQFDSHICSLRLYVLT